MKFNNLNILLFFLSFTCTALMNYDFEMESLILSYLEPNIQDIDLDDLPDKTTTIELVETEVNSTIYQSYIQLTFNINSCDEMFFKLNVSEDKNATPVNITFYYTNNLDDIYNNNSKYINGINNLTLRTYDLSFYNINTFYILFVQKENETNLGNFTYEITFELTNDYDNMMEEKSYNKTTKSKDFYYKRDQEILNNKTIILTLLSSGLYNFHCSYDFYLADKTKVDGQTLNTKQFFNGYALIINNQLFDDIDQIEKFLHFDLKLENDNEIITIETRRYQENNYIDDKDIKHFDIILKDNIERECYIFNKENNKEYILNFLSLTKNIIANFINDDNSETELFTIDKESMTYKIDTSKYNKVCFAYNKLVSDFGSLSFEVMETKNNLDPDNIVIYNNFTIIRGLWTHHYLLQGNATFYRPEIYLKGKKVKVNFHMTKGYLNLYNSECVVADKCNYKDEDSILLEKYDDINGFISIKEDIDSTDDNYSPLVYCLSDNEVPCEFDIEIKNIEEQSYLFENLKVYSFSFNNDIEIFKIKTEDLNDENQNIIININSLYNEPTVTISFDNNNIIIDPYKYYLTNNKLFYAIPYNVYSGNKYLSVTITGDKFYYGINYQLKNQDEIKTFSLENSLLYYYQTKETNVKFDCMNKIKDYPYSYILNVNDFGNKLTLSINNDKYPINNYIQKILKNTDKFEISNENDELTNLFNIEYHELSKHNKIFIETSHLYKNQLNSDNTESVYSFFLFDINKNNKIVINFRKDSDALVEISFDNKISPITINELSKIIILNETENICTKYENYSEFIVRIKPVNNLEENIDFSIQITEFNPDLTLIYLPLNTFMSNILMPNYNHRYHTEIEKGKIGKIYVDFLEGEGLASAKISNTSNYEDGKDLNYEYKYKSIDINSNYTDYCKDRCYIFIDIKLDENSVYNSSYKYDIYSKINIKNNNFYLTVPELENIFGYLENKNDIHYYKTKITKNINKIAFHINCDYCHLDIYYDGNSESTNILFKDEYILKPSISDYNFYGKEIYYTITNNEIVSSQIYNIKIMSFENEKKLLIPINSIKNEFCKIGKNSPCYFVISKEEYTKIKQIRLLVPNNEKARIYIEDALTSNNLNEQDSYKEKYDVIKINDIYKFEKYIITIKLDYDDIITFVSTIYDSTTNQMNYMYPEDYIIENLNKNNVKIYPLKSNGIIYYDINLINGKGTVKANKDEYYDLESGFKDNLNILFETKDDSSIEVETDDEFTFYYRIILYNHNNNLAEINFQKTNYYKYLNINDDLQIWPLNFFMKVNITQNDKSNLKDINFNYKFSNYYEEGSIFAPSDEFYNTTIYLVDEYYIFKKKYNLDIIENYDNIDCISDYREELTAGYSLINADLISNKMKDSGNYYLFISINYTQNISQSDNNKINATLTVFDYNKDYNLPMNEYLLMLINQPRNISISKTYENKDNYNPFIEYALYNITFSAEPNIKEKDKYPSNGKTFYKLEENSKYNLIIKEDGDNSKNAPNLLIKYGLSKYSDFSYFKLEDVNIKNNSETQTMSFKPIEDNIKDQFLYENDKIYAIYTIKIYRVSDIYPIIQENIYENMYNPIHTKKIIDNNLGEGKDISYNISFLEFGNYYLSVFAEGRKGNIYEYLAYKPQYYEKIEDLTEMHIDIDYNNKNFTPKYSRSVKYTAEVHTNNDEDEDYIKLSLKHLNYYDDNYIFVSEDSKLYNTEKFEKLYNDSEYKVINRNTSLIIPVKELKNKTLYIRIPCKELCDYTLFYQIYKKENILIKDNECFDININEKDVNFKYNIKNNVKNSLFTMTSYSINDFKAYDDDDIPLEKTYFNGYSYLYDPNENDKKTDLTFKISGADFRIKVCHRFLNNKANNDNNNNENDCQKIIFDGDIKYTRIQKGKKDCFSIYKDNNNMNDIKNYKINFITKTKNIKINLYKNDKNDKNDILSNEESFNYTFNSEYNEFCLSNNDNFEEDTSVLFQLLSINENNYINQSLNMPLIRGISTKQHLEKGKILYYRITENSKDSQLINLDFYTISGQPKVYYTQLDNFPYQSISDSDNLGEEIKGFRNNIKYNKTIGKRDIYQKSSIPVIVVKCSNEEKEDDCNYYIEMSNDFETILLNKNRKIYSNIEKGKINNYKIDLSLYDIKNNSPKMYIQLYSFTGEPEITISDNTNKSYDYYNYNNNGMLFDLNLDNKNLEFKINIKGNNENNSYYSLFYYIIYEDYNEIYLPSGEVHYLIMNKGTLNFYFQDKLKTTNIEYIVSINAINCELDINKEVQLSDDYGVERIWNIQKKINYNDKITISNELDKKCQYTISAVELTNEQNYNELIINDRTYQYYQFSNNYKSANINYLLSEEDLKKNIFIYVNKKTNNILKIKYNDESQSTYTLYKNSEMIELTNLTKYSKFNEYLNLYNLSITIESIETDQNDIEFKIKINSNKYKYRSYLDPDEIESDIIVKEKEIKYYYEYYYYNDGAEKDQYIEQIYLDCKGIAKLYTNDSRIEEKDKDKTYINIPNKKECSKGCIINFSVKLDNDNDDKNDINIYNIYLVSNYKKLKIFQNVNIYGILYNKIKPKFLTDIGLNVENLYFNLNCLKCKAIIQIKDQTFTIFKSEIIKLSKGHNGKVSYYIENTDEKNKKNIFYYYFSILNPKTPKLIYQKESNICQNNCKYILPIYDYFSFTQKNILLYVPETEEITIYEKLYTMDNFNYDNLTDFNLEEIYDKNSKMLPISNRLYINEEEYINKSVYILIQVKTNLENPFNFTISEFYKIFDENLILYPTNLFIINNNKELSISFDISYKIKIQLINGSGYFLLEKDKFYLNYDSQEIVFIPNNNKKITFYNSLYNEDFIVYLVMGNGNNDLTLQKTNYIKSLNNDFSTFEITFNFEVINYNNTNNKKDLFINYHFSKLERENNNNELLNTSNEIFKSEISCDKNIENLNVNTKYYNDTRRGYIHIESIPKGYNSFNLVIKQITDKYKYKNVYLEVTPFFIDNTRKEPFEFPRNVYLEFTNKNQTFSLSKPSNEYNSFKIEYANKVDFAFNTSSKDIKNYGKFYFTIKNDSLKYNMNIEQKKNEQFLLKYTLKKENQSDFYLINNKIMIQKEDNDKKNNRYKITFLNIKNDNITDYKISYLIRLYNYLEFSEDYVINNIFTETKAEHSFRKELTEKEINDETISHVITFGELDNGDHSISVLGEVYYNDNVEYFSYDFEKFNVREDKPVYFDYAWIAPLIFVILVFIIIVLVLIKNYINSKKEKKEKSTKLLENKINI